MTETPSPTIDLNSPWDVSPGIGGFFAFFILAVALILLVISMLRHVRKANFRAAEREAELYGPATSDAQGVDPDEPADGDEESESGGTRPQA